MHHSGIPKLNDCAYNRSVPGRLHSRNIVNMPPLLTVTIFQNSEYHFCTVHPAETMNEYLSGGSAIFLSEVQTVLLIDPREIDKTRICRYQYPKLSA